MDKRLVSSWQLPALFGLFLGLWLLRHPYFGTMHDAVLYCGQALRYLHPENFARDVFYLYGSQDDYTLFSPIFAGLIKVVGLGEAAMLITLAGVVLWCYAAWRVSALWQGGSRWLFLFLLALMPIKYGGNEILAAAESFAVPRLWADALTLLACALWLEGRRYRALALWLLGMLVHPLMALAGALFVLLYELRFNLRWGGALLAATLATCALALSGAPLFGRLFQVMDPVWFDLVYQRTKYYMFPLAWTLKDYNILVFHAVALLWAGWLTEDVRLKRLFFAACATGLLGLLAGVIGGDWLHSVLILQVQPWRTLWLMYVLGWGAAAWLVVHLWKPARFAVLGLAAAWLLREHGGGVILLAVALLYWQRQSLSRATMRWLEGALLVGMFFSLAWTVSDASTFYTAISPEYEPDGLQKLLMWRDGLNGEAALLWLATGGFAYWAWRRQSRAAVALLFVFVVFLMYGKNWDIRSLGLKNLESGSAWEQTPFNAHIPRNATVYWLNGLQPTWLLLGRSSYYSQHQSAGLVFSRPLTMELYRRHLQIRPLGSTAADFRLLSRKEVFFERFQKSFVDDPVTFAGLNRACADPELDFAILPKRYVPWVKAAWFAPDFGTAFDNGLGNGLYLYACEDLRKNLPARD